jgi:hypothetical protein
MPPRSRLPRQVVRFYGNVDFALDTIAHRQLIFVHASKLNDPFDPYFFFETDFKAEYSSLLHYVESRYPNDREWFIREVPELHWTRSVQAIANHFNALKDSVYLFSTSAEKDNFHPKDNLYMWGHYGNGHRGVALEFDTEQIAAPLIAQHHKEKGQLFTPQDVWIRVNYEACLPPLTRAQFFQFFKNEHDGGHSSRTALEESYDQIGRTKARVWSSENEWRLLWHNTNTRLKVHRVGMSETAIKTVYIGQNASASSQADVVFETKHKFPAAKIFKASKRRGAFAVDFEEIGLDPTFVSPAAV